MELVLDAVTPAGRLLLPTLLADPLGREPEAIRALLEQLPIGLIVMDADRAEQLAERWRRSGAVVRCRAVRAGARRCRGHAQVRAVTSCRRCGAPLCRGCFTNHRRCPYCPTHRPAWALAVLGVLGIAFLSLLPERGPVTVPVTALEYPRRGPGAWAPESAAVAGSQDAAETSDAPPEAEVADNEAPGPDDDASDDDGPDDDASDEAGPADIATLRAALAREAPEAAAAVGREALATAADYTQVRALAALLADAAEAARNRGELDAAVLLAETGLLRPSLAEDALHTTAALALLTQGQTATAAEHFSAISTLFPRYSDVKQALDAAGAPEVEVDCARLAERSLSADTQRRLRGHDDARSAHFRAWVEDDHVTPPAERLADFLQDLEASWAQATARYGDPGGGPLPVLFLVGETFANHFRGAADPEAAGFYRPTEDYIAINLKYAFAPTDSTRGTIAHEVTHAVLRRLSGGWGIHRWLNEGLATLEGARRTGQPALSAESWSELASRRLSLTPMAELQFSVEDAGPAYRQGTAAATLLLERHGLPAVRDHLARRCRGSGIDTAFKQSFGLTVPEFERSFVEWLGEKWATPALLAPIR